jgi:hypothetical protein
VGTGRVDRDLTKSEAPAAGNEKEMRQQKKSSRDPAPAGTSRKHGRADRDAWNRTQRRSSDSDRAHNASWRRAETTRPRTEPGGEVDSRVGILQACDTKKIQEESKAGTALSWHGLKNP